MDTQDKKAVLIVGQGYVGRAMKERLRNTHDVYTFDIKDDDAEVLFDQHRLRHIDAVMFCTYVDINEPDRATSEMQQLLDLYSTLFPDTLMVICSTLHPEQLDKLKFNNPTVLMPEFFSARQMRQDRTWSRCIVGYDQPIVLPMFHNVFPRKMFYYLTVSYMSMRQAALIKLATNAYLAMRVSFMNSVADLADLYGQDPLSTLAGVCGDPRIGTGYAKPSFAYSGPCLPKDTKALATGEHPYSSGSLFSDVSFYNVNRGHLLDTVIEHAERKGKQIGFNRISFAPGAEHERCSHLVASCIRTADRTPDNRVYFYDNDATTQLDWLARCDTLEALFERVDVVFSETRVDEHLTKAFPNVQVVYPWSMRRYLKT